MFKSSYSYHRGRLCTTVNRVTEGSTIIAQHGFINRWLLFIRCFAEIIINHISNTAVIKHLEHIYCKLIIMQIYVYLLQVDTKKPMKNLHTSHKSFIQYYMCISTVCWSVITTMQQIQLFDCVICLWSRY